MGIFSCFSAPPEQISAPASKHNDVELVESRNALRSVQAELDKAKQELQSRSALPAAETARGDGASTASAAAAVEEQVRVLQSKLEEATSGALAQAARAKILEGQLATTSEQLAQRAEIVETAKQTTKALEAEVAALTERLTALQTEHQLATEELVRQASKISTAEAQAADATASSVQTLNSKIAALETTAGEQGAKAEALEAQLAQKVGAAAAAGEQLSAVQLRADALQRERDTLKSELERTIGEKTIIQQSHDVACDEARELQREVRVLESKLTDLHDKASQSQAGDNLGLVSARLEKTTVHVEQLELKLSELQKENEQLLDVQAAVAASEAAAAALQAQVGRLERERGALEEQLAALRAKLVERDAEHSALTSEFNQLSQTVDSHSAVNDATSGQAQQLLGDYMLLKEKNAALVNEAKLKDDMMELLQQQLSELADMDLDKILLTAMPANRTPQRVSRVSSASKAAR